MTVRAGQLELYKRLFYITMLTLFIIVVLKNRHDRLHTSIHANEGNYIYESTFRRPVSRNADLVALLASTIRILCICQTTKKRHQDRAVMVKQTWGRRCSKLIFASDEIDEQLPAYRFADQEGRAFVTFKMRTAFQWTYDHEINNYDWFLKADDDSFVVMENLRAFLSKFNPNNDHYFGRHFSVKGSVIGESFVSGAAYVLSRSALERLATQAFPNGSICPYPVEDGHEDVNLGYCFKSLGIYPGETRDKKGRHRFLVFAPWIHLSVGATDDANWIRRYDKFPYVEGENCCSDTAIALHYVPSGFMVALEYFLYRLRPLGFHAEINDKDKLASELLPQGAQDTVGLSDALVRLGYTTKRPVSNGRQQQTAEQLKQTLFLR